MRTFLEGLLSRDFSEPNFKTDRQEILAPMPDLDDFLEKKTKSHKKKYCHSLVADPILTKAQEYHIFRRMNYFRWRFKQIADNPSKKNTFAILLKKYHEDRHQIFNSNIRLLLWLSNKHHAWLTKRFRLPTDFNSYEELISVINTASMGLLNAIDFFDYRKGIRFASYSSFAIVRSLREQEKNKTRQVKVCRERHEDLLFVKDRHPYYSECSTEILSIDKADPRHFTSAQLLKLTCDRHNDIAQSDNIELYDRLLSIVTEREREILKKHYENGMELLEIAQEKGVSHQAISQSHLNALKKIRKYVEQIHDL